METASLAYATLALVLVASGLRADPLTCNLNGYKATPGLTATDLPAFGKHHFEIPFDATGKKWVRFAVWDSAGNGASSSRSNSTASS